MNNKKSVLALSLAAVVLLAASASFGGALEDGDAALKQKDYPKAMSLLLPMAREGNTFAQYNVGVMYADGLGTEKNETEAVKWYRKAADQGHVNAQVNLGLAYDKGRGLEKDPKKAMEWYSRAARQGSAMAQNNIGSLYFNGEGVKKDDKMAVEWYSKAAQQGLPVAQNSLGGMYVKGWGVEKDADKGLEWIMKAAEQGLPIARENAFKIYYNGAQQGSAESMHNVATLCLKGWAGKQNPMDCITWYEQAARKGVDASRNALAEIYDKGMFDIAPDAKKAQYWKAQVGKKAG
ncbi:MAG TPA: tetratricopeptide repeat protein [Burkholderiales bacterium]|nr:tetratricopeptide repeat protein [Burkholderiales bacterium]